jgi:hypothetical protein
MSVAPIGSNPVAQLGGPPCTEPAPRGPRRLARLISLSALMLVGAAAALALGCADEPTAGSPIEATAEQLREDVRRVARTDPRSGVRFEIQTSTLFGTSSLYLALTPATSAHLRDRLRGEQVLPGCDVPGVSVRGFAQLWGRHADQAGTALIVDPEVSVADRAVRCWLEIGEPGPRPNAVLFTGDVVAEVEIRR